jgi:hypothetical protein
MADTVASVTKSLSNTEYCIPDLLPEKDKIVFAATVQYHFENAKACWKQKRIPGPKTISKIIDGCWLAGSRFWPGQLDKPYKMFALIISESGGLNVGNPEDPSYGVCHATYETARTACAIFGIQSPKSKWDFKEKLSEDVFFNILCGAGEAKIAESYSNGDWVRVVLIYKHGVRGFNRAMTNLDGKPITELPVWKHYSSLLLWIQCLKERVELQVMTPCGCLPDPAAVITYDEYKSKR